MDDVAQLGLFRRGLAVRPDGTTGARGSAQRVCTPVRIADPLSPPNWIWVLSDWDCQPRDWVGVATD